MKYPKFEIIPSTKDNTIQIKESDLIKISRDKDGIFIGEKSKDGLLNISFWDENFPLLEKSFWLSKKYDWVIVQNENGNPYLVPLKKEK